MEHEKCCNQCGVQIKESSNIDLNFGQKCQILNETEEDYLKLNTSEINGSKTEIILDSETDLNETEHEKCCIQCGVQFKESNNIGCTVDQNCQILNEIKQDCIESNISEITGSEIESNTKDSGVILNSQKDLNISEAKYQKVNVANSQNVIIGNVTYITGPIHVTQTTTHIEEQNITNQLFYNDSELEKISLNIISRDNWMAQPPRQTTHLPEIPKYVIIAHTATESGYTQPQNALLVKLIQTYHMESHKWDDLAYNFLVGCDGNIYEGRGWNIQGAHTYGYNRKSICIAFIGCFMNQLPPISSLNAARKLIIEGVKLGFIPHDYTLVGHCQCSPLESPGVQVINEIKKWPRWRELTPEDGKS